MGAIQCYASYLREKDDVALTGLSTTSANEFAEVVLGGSVAIPAAATFFGITATQVIASQGTFYLGFASMPPVFEFIPLGQVLGALWFFLLFIAAITSVMALAQPMIAFLEDEFGLPRGRAVAILGALWFPSTHLCIFLSGALDVMDFLGWHLRSALVRADRDYPDDVDLRRRSYLGRGASRSATASVAVLLL
jgi:NSS family neurotransmitter:Na+ symporter